MGYFSELDLELHEEYNEPWDRNLWLMERLEELRGILKDFNIYGEPELGEEEELYIYTDNDIMYMLPEDFRTIADLERAIDICIWEIDEDYMAKDTDNNILPFEDEDEQLVA